MNRLSPPIARHHAKPVFGRRGRWENLPEEAPKDPLADLKQFATGWLAGLVFFGTFLS